jgi:hypothetical protein
MGETPWPFNEVIGHADVKANISGDKYMGVKIGDVDGGAQANLQQNNLETRSLGTGFNPFKLGIVFSIEDKSVKAGELVIVEFKASQFTQVYGFQMSAKLSGLNLVSAEGRGIDLDNNNVAMFAGNSKSIAMGFNPVNRSIGTGNNESQTSLSTGFSPYIMNVDPNAGFNPIKGNVMTMSWSSSKAATVANDSKVMILTFKATESGQLSKMIQLVEMYSRTSDENSKMRSESYIGESMELGNVSLEIRSDVQPNVFNVSQNEPNPWKGETTIRYELPKAGPVTISVYDITGRNVWTYVSTTAKAGQNALTITRDQLSGATGVMIYKIESGEFTGQKKMIVID